MQFQIDAILIWPSRQDLEPKVIRFKRNAINILTGESQMGKSALLTIIDYCLVSDKCAIPVGLIRRSALWFGIQGILGERNFTLARKSPQDGSASSDVYFDLNHDIPRIINKNTSLDAVKAELNNATKIPNIRLSIDDDSGFFNSTGIRDIVALNFQPQHIVANPYTLFFKADTSEHREKLKNVLPLVLGIQTPDQLVAQHQLKEVQRQIDEQQKELEQQKAISNKWRGELEGYYLKAVELGLIADIAGRHQPIDVLISSLNHAIRIAKENPPAPTSGSAESVIAELHRIINDEERLSRDIGRRKSRLLNLHRLRDSFSQYRDGYTDEQDRIRNAGWLVKRLNESSSCPFCSSPNQMRSELSHKLTNMISDISTAVDSVKNSPVVVDGEIQDLSKELRKLEESFRQVRKARSVLEEGNKQIRIEQQKIREVYRFIGQMEKAIDGISLTTGTPQDISLGALTAEASRLRAIIDLKNRNAKKIEILNDIANRLKRYALILGVERSDETCMLNLIDLNIQIGNGSKADYLWEIGSGSNWMGYHIAVMLAIHEYLFEKSIPHVPSLLLLDQPSQVFFPDAWIDIASPNAGEDKKTNSDIEGVRRIFEALAAFITKINNFQIIVLEHAGSATWEGISNVHVIGNWRRNADGPLIPASWATASIENNSISPESPPTPPTPTSPT